MLGSRCPPVTPDRSHPHQRRREPADLEARALPRERVRSLAHLGLYAGSASTPKVGRKRNGCFRHPHKRKRTFEVQAITGRFSDHTDLP